MTKTKKLPLRKCVGCGMMKEKKELLRVIRTEDETVRLDITGRANGRGAYVCRNIQCLQKAVKTKALQRSLSVQIPEEVLLNLEKEMMSVEE